MIYKVQGTVHHIEEVETFSSRNGGTYRKQNIVLAESDERGHENNIQLKAFGEAVDETEDLREGEAVSATFFISAREYNGKWYNDLNLVHVRRTAPVTPAEEYQKELKEQRTAQAKAKVEAILNGTAPESPDGDLPF